MLRRETAMVFRMPVLRGDDEVISAIVNQGVGDRDHLVTISNGKITAGAKPF